MRIFVPIILSAVCFATFDATSFGGTDKFTEHLEQGVDLVQKHELTAAEKEFQLALSLAENEKNQLKINSCFNNLATLALSSGNFPDAEKYYRSSLVQRNYPRVYQPSI